ncbi:MAG: transposase [Thermoguttaceae bacterium]|jgi:putative transposase
MERDPSSIDRRRKKVHHFDEPSHAHFLTFSCYHRLPLLNKDRSRYWLIEALQAARQKHGFDLWGWVIMPEHVHLLLWPKPGYQIQTILADIKRPIGQQAIHWLEENRPDFLERLTVRNRNRTYHRFWQAGPGQDRNIYDPNAAHQVLEYIHNNPVQRGLVALPEQWQWSSTQDWAGGKDVLLKVDRTVPTVLKIVP